MVQPRQLIFIMTDTQRWDMVNCYRNTGLQTPQLDRLAAGGVRYERAYTCQPVCGPARSALFTGTFPHSNGSWGNHQPLGAGIKTLGQRLSAAGVHAGYIGKWHLDAFDYFGRGEAPDGWDAQTWYDMRNYLMELTPEDRVRSRKGSTTLENIPDDFTFGHRCSTRAVEFLKKNKDQDFCLVVSYDEPHGPYLCPTRYHELYKDYRFPASPNHEDTLEDKPEHLRVWSQVPKNLNAGLVAPNYFGCNTFVDAQIGRVLDAIDAHCPEALVIYTSDHGEMLTSHRISNKGPAIFDEITRIPFIVRWPGTAPVGAIGRDPVTQIDVTPTILDYFGIPTPNVLQGRSMLPSFRDPSVRINDAIFLEFARYEVDQDGFGGYQPIRCVIDGQFKLGINLLTSDELYDVRNDPHEMRNLINSPEHSKIRNSLHDRLLKWMEDTRDPFRGYYWERRSWRTDATPETWHYTRISRSTRVESGPQPLDYSTGLEITTLDRPM